MAWTSSKSGQPSVYGFCEFCYSTDLTNIEDVVAAVAGKSIYLESLTIQCVAAIGCTWGSGNNAGAVKVPYSTLLFAATSGSPFTQTFKRGLILAVGEALTMKTSGAGVITVCATGYIK